MAGRSHDGHWCYAVLLDGAMTAWMPPFSGPGGHVAAVGLGDL